MQPKQAYGLHLLIILCFVDNFVCFCVNEYFFPLVLLSSNVMYLCVHAKSILLRKLLFPVLNASSCCEELLSENEEFVIFCLHSILA